MKPPKSHPLRVLHVVGRMNRGGVETWLMHVLRRIDRRCVHVDFIVHTTHPGAYDDEIRDLGSKIFPCMRPSLPSRYARNLRRILDEHGPYRIVHSHVHHYSGFILWLAHKAGIPQRVAHCHSDTELHDGSSHILRKGYLRMMEYLIRNYATKGLACSRQAAAALYGANWEKDPRWQVFYCGIDLDPFKQQIEQAAVRREFGIPPDAFVIGHVGRFSEVKNHAFLVKIASHMATHDPDMRLLMVGDGPLRPQIENRAAALKTLKGKVIFSGIRSDVPRVMRAMDVLVMPSFYEGLPVVGIEAQAAGLPLVVSDTITDELEVAEFFPVRRVSLASPETVWADAIRMVKERTLNRQKAVRMVENSAFGIDNSVKALMKHYDAR